MRNAEPHSLQPRLEQGPKYNAARLEQGPKYNVDFESKTMFFRFLFIPFNIIRAKRVTQPESRIPSNRSSKNPFR